MEHTAALRTCLWFETGGVEAAPENEPEHG